MNLNPTHHASQVADVNIIPVCNFPKKQVILRMMAKQLGPVNRTKLILVSITRIIFRFCLVIFFLYFVNPKWFSLSENE
jgi:hypothetical protein